MCDQDSGIEFNVGVDVEEHERFLELTQIGRLQALFSEEEIEHSRRDAQSARGLAGTWCAKEAVVKALWPWVRLEPRRVLVLRDTDGRPHVRIVGWDASAERVSVRVSISHSTSTAMAAAVAWGLAPEERG